MPSRADSELGITQGACLVESSNLETSILSYSLQPHQKLESSNEEPSRLPGVGLRPDDIQCVP